MDTLNLLNYFNKLISNNTNANYIMLSNVDKLFGIKLVQDTDQQISLSQIIPKTLSIVENLAANNVSFALWTWVKNSTIPDNLDATPQKMYLNVPINDAYNTCNINNGMLQFNDKLTKGSVFNLSEVSKFFIKNTRPYKYIDYSNTRYDNIAKNWYIESIFYNLKLKHNSYSISYCEIDCDTSNPNGMCAQEKIDNSMNSSGYVGKGKTDAFGLKNVLKFKIEPDNSITPYFISMNPEERIHYITNKYSTLYNPNDYKTIVQVPVYTNNDRYYEQPVYTPPTLNNKGYYTTTNVDINNLSRMYTDEQVNNYQSAATFSVSETQIDKNDAYLDYAYNFNVEVITDDVYSNLL